MKVPCEEIAGLLKKNLIKRVKQLKKKKYTPKLVTFLVGDSSEQVSYVSQKQKMAKSLGIAFEFKHIKETPSFGSFARLLKETSNNPEVTGMIIQQPLPSRLYTETLYNFIDPVKEIEGHHPKTAYFPPIGLAVLVVLKYIFHGQKVNDRLLIDPQSDFLLFKQGLKHKRVVLVGRGPTGGQPIGKVLNHFRIGFINVNSKTPEPQQYYKEADVIITAAGKKVLGADMVKEGAILINVGLRKERGKLKGDYEEKEIKKASSWYTSTPKGVGPIDVLYLYENLIEAAEIQAHIRKS